MSAPALALAKPERRTVVVRLADVSATVGWLSLFFGLLLVCFPQSFPRLIQRSFQNGRLILAMMAITLAVDAYLYFRIAYRLSARPTVVAAACLGSLPVMVVTGLSFLLQIVVSETIESELPHLQARIGEEILAHTYLAMVSAIFLPFLVIRLLQQIRSAGSPGPA